MTDPRSRSRSRALQSWKSGRFQKLSPPAFTTGAGNWPRILKLGHNIKIWWGRVFDIRSTFVSRDFEVGTNVSCKESTVSPHTGLFFIFVFQRGCHGSWPTYIPLNTPLILHSFFDKGHIKCRHWLIMTGLFATVEKWLKINKFRLLGD